MFTSFSLKLALRWFSAAEEGTGIIASQEAFDVYPWPEAEDFNYSALDNISRYLPQGAKVIVNVGYIFMASWMLMGLETFCATLVDNPDLVQKVVDKVGTVQHRVMEIILDYDCVGAARMPDDMAYGTGTIISPAHLRRYIFPWYRNIGQLVHSKNLPYLLHSDGRLYEVLDDLIDCGFNALHPIEPNSMDIEYLKKQYGHWLCLCSLRSAITS